MLGAWVLSAGLLHFSEAGGKMECGLVPLFLRKTSSPSAFKGCFDCACELSLGF